MDGTLQIDIGHHDGATVLSVAGEIDLATAPMLDEKITAAFQAGTEDTVIVDLDRVSFMDSSGLQVLLGHIFSEQNGRRIRLTKGSPQVYRLFDSRRGAWAAFQFLVRQRLRDEGAAVAPDGTLT